MLSFDPSIAGYTPAQTELFYNTLTNRVRVAPGVKPAALANAIPTGNVQGMEQVIPEGYQLPRGRRAWRFV